MSVVDASSVLLDEGVLVHVAVIGAGPAGLVLGAGLARRGATVTLVDRDPGPPTDGVWARRGVMQFHHAHAPTNEAFGRPPRPFRESPCAPATLTRSSSRPNP